MDARLKHTLQYQCINAFSLCVIGIALFFAENAWLGRDTAIQQMPCIVYIATLFFSLSLLSSFFYMKIMRKGGKQAAGFYLLYKGIKLMFAIAMLVFYAFASHNNLLAFSLNLFVLYLVEMITSIIYYTRMEHITKLMQ